MTHAITEKTANARSGRITRAAVLVLAIHGSPGDPRRAREEFAFLGGEERPLEILLLNDKELPALAQLGHLAREHEGRELVVAPLLLGEGYHFTHDLLPAVEAARKFGAQARLLPLFGRAEIFLRALHEAVLEHAPPGFKGKLAWLVPGGAQVAASLREALELIRPELAERSTWHVVSRVEAPPAVPRDALPLVAVLRDGRIVQALRKGHLGAHSPQPLFAPRHLKAALQAWAGG